MNSTNHSTRIMHLIDKIRVVTAELLENFSVKKFLEIIGERSTLILLINKELDEQKRHVDTVKSEKEHSKEIEYFLEEIMAMDLNIFNTVKLKMNELRQELKGLSKSAPVALAYSHHKRQ